MFAAADMRLDHYTSMFVIDILLRCLGVCTRHGAEFAVVDMGLDYYMFQHVSTRHVVGLTVLNLWLDGVGL